MKKQTIIFWLILISIPILILTGLEFSLRLLNYGAEVNLTRQEEIGGVKYYVVNEKIARRYFTQDNGVIPEAKNDLFRVEKTPNTFRIFCLGGSTTAGWPFLYNGTFPGILQNRLKNLFPEKTIEVVNWGISAVNSFSVLDMAPELLKLQPDLFLIYMGHNEFYGAFGVGSTQVGGKNRFLIKLNLKLRKFKLVQFVRNQIAKIRNKKPTVKAGTLMERMVRQQLIRFQDENYQITCDNFQANLQEILDTIKNENIPVIVGTLVKNLHDFEPFISVFSPDFQDSLTWKNYFTAGEQAQQNSDFHSALTFYQKATQLDNSHALLAYRQARCFEQLNRIDSSRVYFRRANDLDALRFRASEEFNEIIRNCCARQNVPVAEIESLFEKNSPNGLIGNNLIIEHLHPNLNGYSLMAEAFQQKILQGNWLILPEAKNSPEITGQTVASVSDLEIEIANQRIQQLTSRWPFRQKLSILPPDSSDWRKRVKEFAQKVLTDNLPFNDAHYQLADFAIKNGAFSKAEDCYRAVINVRPINYYPWLFLGNLYFRQNKFKEAEQSYLQSLKLSKNLPFAYAKLGLFYLNQGLPQKAIPFLENAIERGANRFDAGEMAQARYLLATALAQTNNFKPALEAASSAQALQPENREIDILIRKIKYAMQIKK